MFKTQASMKNSKSIPNKFTLVPILSSIVLTYLLLVIVPITRAENIISAGTTLKCLAGTSIVSMENLTIRSGATLDNAGTLILKKDLVNQNVAPVSIGAGTVICSGTVPQALNGPSYMQNLTINNPSGITNGGYNKVNGILTLTSGLVILGTNDLALGSGATIAGAPSATAMLVPTSSGQVLKEFPGIGSFTFPVGDNTGVAEYTPVTLSFTAGTFSTGNYTGVKLVNAIYPGSPTVNYIKRYWYITQSGISSFTCNPTFQYVPADVVGTENLIYCMRITPSTVNYFNVANTTLHQLSAASVTYFGTFTGNQVLADKTLNLNVFLESLYNGGGTMRKAQNAAGDQFAGTTADQISVELRNSASYASLVYILSNLNLSTAGACTVTVPGIFNSSYYVTIRHRNSIETTTASAVSFASSPVNYNFTNLATKAYGSNMKSVSGGYWAFYAGDVSQDGAIDAADLIPTDNAAANALHGYLTTDVNGDGSVNATDITLIYNNSNSFVKSITP
jgi:hypothetical protein